VTCSGSRVGYKFGGIAVPWRAVASGEGWLAANNWMQLAVAAVTDRNNVTSLIGLRWLA